MYAWALENHESISEIRVKWMLVPHTLSAPTYKPLAVGWPHKREPSRVHATGCGCDEPRHVPRGLPDNVRPTLTQTSASIRGSNASLGLNHHWALCSVHRDVHSCDVAGLRGSEEGNRVRNLIRVCHSAERDATEVVLQGFLHGRATKSSIGP